MTLLTLVLSLALVLCGWRFFVLKQMTGDRAFTLRTAMKLNPTFIL